jgi:hypothetical protein
MFSLTCTDKKIEIPPVYAQKILFVLYDFSRKQIPRFIKKTLIKSGNPIVAKIISVGKKAIKNAANKATLSFSVNS